MTIDSIQNGYVIDHIRAGKCMEIYNLLGLDTLGCPVAVIMNVVSSQLGKKDIIKIDSRLELDLDVLGYIDPGITINKIRDGQIVSKRHIELPERLVGVIRCKNPRCITSTEQELPHIFKLTDSGEQVYRCIYCEAKAKRQ